MENDNHEHLNDVISNQDSTESAAEEVESSLEAAYEPERDDFSRKFAALSRREKEIRAKEAEYDQRIADLEHRFSAREPQKEPEIPFDVQLRQNPLKALESVGLSYDKLTELALNDGKLTPEMQMKLMREEIENGYKSKFEELEKKMSEKDQTEKTARYDRIQKNYLNKVSNFVDKNSDAYEFIKANNASDVVYDVVEQHYKESGKILTIKEAADAVESHFEGEAEKLLKLKKVGARLQAYINQPKTPEQPKPNKPVTLTNAHSQQSLNEQPKRLLSDEESKLEIAKMLQWLD